MFPVFEPQDQIVDFSYLVGKTVKAVHEEHTNCVSFWVTDSVDGFIRHQVVRFETTPSGIPGLDALQLVRMGKVEKVDA